MPNEKDPLRGFAEAFPGLPLPNASRTTRRKISSGTPPVAISGSDPTGEHGVATYQGRGPDPAVNHGVVTYHGGGPFVPNVADAYRETTEKINPLIIRAEKALAALRLSVSASVDIETDPDRRWCRCLRFAKAGKEWLLFVDTGPDGGEAAEWQSDRLINASREVRVKALRLLPQLEKALFACAQEQLNDAAKAINETEDYLAGLEARAK